MRKTSVSFVRHRFPGVVISYAVWLYLRFSVSYRDVEELLTQRGSRVSYETIRRWCRKFSQSYANQLKRRFARAGDEWYLDEVRVVINGEVHWLWRAVDQHSSWIFWCRSDGISGQPSDSSNAC